MIKKLFKRGVTVPDQVKISSGDAIPFIDCQGLAGHWTAATCAAGFELVHRASLGAFGDAVIESNRHLVPGPWEQDTANGAYEWEPAQAGYLIGTPPCSGFSLLNNSKNNNKRGPESNINDCMWELVRYASRCTGLDCKPGPEIVSFESVQGAYSQGRSLMQALRAELEKLTGQKYALTHVLTAGATIGAAQMRHRFYFVAHRIPFGVDMPEKRRVVTYRDAIGDLEGLEDTWVTQSVKDNAEQNWWLLEQNMLDKWDKGPKNVHHVDAHIGADNARVRTMCEELEPHWPAGKNMEVAMRNYREAKGKFPDNLVKMWDYDRDAMKGFAHPTRVHPDRLGYVCTGGCTTDFMHYSEPRMLSLRECSRLMGLPDTWKWTAVQSVTQGGAFTGKCCPWQTGKWISEWAYRALAGNPGSPLTKIGDNEFYHNSTNLYRPWLKEQGGDMGSTKPEKSR